METFPALLALSEGNPPVTGGGGVVGGGVAGVGVGRWRVGVLGGGVKELPTEFSGYLGYYAIVV